VASAVRLSETGG